VVANSLLSTRSCRINSQRARRSSGPRAHLQERFGALHNESVDVFSKVEVGLWLLAMLSWSKEGEMRERRSDGLPQELVG
jgi:hypothetical protein